MDKVIEGTNAYLQAAKNNKNDEFYTTYETIEAELCHYTDQLKGKTVFCNCDDPFESNFCKFFIRKFNEYGLKRLICTSYSGSPMAGTQLSFFEDNSFKQGYLLDIRKVPSGTLENGELNDDEIAGFLKHENVHELNGSGDFRSEECEGFLSESDVVITNPPFSLFRELIALLEKYKKKYLLIGNMNAVNYKEIFPLIQNNKAWLGYHNGDMAFRVPADSEPRKTRFWIDETGQKWRSLGNAMWFTNLDVAYRHKNLELKAKYDPDVHVKFDDYDAIYVPKVADIPYDYAGIMAVPITILTKYNPAQFRIVGEANHGSDNSYDLFKPVIKGKLMYKRILIQRIKERRLHL
ncbi:MAG: adenine-specific methyltransferase EcoRI family protein [Candidatus Weimeria sp.]